MNRRLYLLLSVGVTVIGLLASCAAPGGAPGQTQTVKTTGERVTVTMGTINNHIIATGKVTARATTTLSFSSSGTVKAVSVKVGDKVKAGQPLMSLVITQLELTAKQQYANYLNAQASYSETIKPATDTDVKAAQEGVISAREAYSQSLKGGTSAEYASAYASVKSAQAALKALDDPPSEYDVADLKAKLQNAEATLKKKQAAYDSAYQRNPAGIGGTNEGLDLETATNDYQSAKANYDAKFQKAAAKDYESARATLASAQSTLAGLSPTKEKAASAAQTLAQAQSKLNGLTPTAETVAQSKAKLDQAYAAWQSADQSVKDATLTAPFDGIVTKVDLQAGDTASGEAVQIADFNVPLFEVDVDETDMGSIKVGQEATVQLQSYSDVQIPAKVESVEPAGTTSGNVVTFKVKLSMNNTGVTANADGGQTTILIGMSGTSQIVTASASNAILIPSRALSVDTQTSTYSVQRVTSSGTTQKVTIKLGYRGTDNVQVVGGLSAGDILEIPHTTTTSSGPGQGGN